MQFIDRGFMVEVIADSIHAINSSRLTTYLLRYPRFIHSELMTHRVFSRNAASSRAIPVMTVLRQVWNDPAMPIHWGANRKGMQAKDELTGWRRWLAKATWRTAGKIACVFAWTFTKVGLHKQVANRILEPWQWMHTLVTATDWENFFTLRCHKDAQPEFQLLAQMIMQANLINVPKELQPGQWHMPFVEGVIQNTVGEALIKSAARCAWTSYKMPNSSADPTYEQCLSTFTKLVGDPMHASPLEHQAQVINSMNLLSKLHRNFTHGWEQHRALREEYILIAERHPFEWAGGRVVE